MLTKILTDNLDVVFFVYGLAFFTIGIAIFVHPRRKSIFKLSGIIWLLAAFGLTHGFNEWLDMFDFIKPNASGLYDLIQLSVLTVSYVFFFEFGRRLLFLSFKDFFLTKRLAGVLYCLLFAFMFFSPGKESSIWPRYILGFPGGVLTACGFIFYYRDNRNILKPTKVRRYFVIASVSVALYGALGGLITPKAEFFPASVMHNEAFLNLVGIPVQLFRAVCASVLAWSVWHILGIFNWEIGQIEQETAAAKATAEAERKRAGELEKLYNELEISHLELEAARYKLVLAEKMQLIGRLASGVAHEVKNPLAIIMQGTDYLKNNIPAQDANASLVLKNIEDAVARADSVIRDLLDFSALSKLEIRPENLNLVIENSLLLLKFQLDKGRIEVVRDFAQDLPPIKIDRNRIEQALVNICLNAIQAMPEGGRLTLKTEENKAGEERGVVLKIKDTGQGIPEDALGKIFEPFFTTKRQLGGTGLGLWVVKNIIELHGAKIDIKNSQDNKGAEVTIFFKI